MQKQNFDLVDNEYKQKSDISSFVRDVLYEEKEDMEGFHRKRVLQFPKRYKENTEKNTK